MYARTRPLCDKQRNIVLSLPPFVRVVHLALPRELSISASTPQTRTQAVGQARENALRFSYRSSVVVTRFGRGEEPFDSDASSDVHSSSHKKYSGSVPFALVEAARARYRDDRRESADSKRETCEKEEDHVSYIRGHNCSGGGRDEKTSYSPLARTVQWRSAEGDVGRESKPTADNPKTVDADVGSNSNSSSSSSNIRSFITSRVALREALHNALGIGRWSSSADDSVPPVADPAACNFALSGHHHVSEPEAVNRDHPLLETDTAAFNWSQLQTYTTMKQAFTSLPFRGAVGFSLAHEESLAAAVTLVAEDHCLAKAGGEEELRKRSTTASESSHDSRNNIAMIINGASGADADENAIKPVGLHVRVGIDIVKISRVRSLVVRQPRFVRRWLPHLLPAVLKTAHTPPFSKDVKGNASPYAHSSASNFSSDADMFVISAHWGLRECLVKIFEENKAVLMGDCCYFYATQTNHLYSAPSCSSSAASTVNSVVLPHADQHAVFKGCTADRLAGLGLSPTIRFFTHIVEGHVIVTAFAFPTRATS